TWRLVFPDGRVADAGEVVEIDPPHRLVLAWRNEWKPEFKDEGFSRASLTLEPKGETVKLTVTHEMERDGAKLIDALGQGWPQILEPQEPARDRRSAGRDGRGQERVRSGGHAR